MSARLCIYCGYGFPRHDYCGALIVPGARFCGKCGLMLPVFSPPPSLDSLSSPVQALFDIISPIDNEERAREFFNAKVEELRRYEEDGRFPAVDVVCRLLGLCFQVMPPERVAMWRRVIVAASVDAALRAPHS